MNWVSMLLHALLNNRLFSFVSGIRLRLHRYVVLQRAIVIPDYNGARHVITGRQMINFQNDISFHNRKTDLQPAPLRFFATKEKRGPVDLFKLIRFWQTCEC